VVIGAGGVERIVEIELNKSESKEFEKSANAVRELIAACQKLEPALAAKTKKSAGKGK
jgi:malate dehydrogenase